MQAATHTSKVVPPADQALVAVWTLLLDCLRVPVRDPRFLVRAIGICSAAFALRAGQVAWFLYLQTLERPQSTRYFLYLPFFIALGVSLALEVKGRDVFPWVIPSFAMLSSLVGFLELGSILRLAFWCVFFTSLYSVPIKRSYLGRKGAVMAMSLCIILGTLLGRLEADLRRPPLSTKLDQVVAARLQARPAPPVGSYIPYAPPLRLNIQLGSNFKP